MVSTRTLRAEALVTVTMAADEERAGLLRARLPTPAGGKLLILLQYAVLAAFVGCFVAVHPALHRAVAKHVVPAAAPSKAPPRPHVAASGLKVASLAKPHLGFNPRPVGVRKGRAKTKMRAVQPGRASLLSEEAPPRPPFPERVALCYASWSECDDRIVTAARQGCNVTPQTPNPKTGTTPAALRKPPWRQPRGKS